MTRAKALRGRGRPAKVDAQPTRERILEAGLDLFASHGYAATSIRQIASAAGITEGSIYNHFDGKDAILREIVASHGPGRVARGGFVLDSSAADVKAELRAFVESFVERMTAPDEVKFGKLMFQQMLAGGSGVDQTIREAGAKLARFFVELGKAKRIRDVDAELAVFELVAPLSLILIENVTFVSGEIDHARVRRRALRHLDFFWDAIAPRG